MKTLVIGYGSIGQRHVQLLGELGTDVSVVSRRDVDAARIYGTVAEAVADWAPDYVVVASRTSEHHRDIAQLAEAGFRGTVLMEKPLFDADKNVPDNGFERIFVGYNMRFHPVVRRFREIIDETTPHAVHAYVGQYLPDWRPDADYRRGYSAIRAEGGGVLRDLSHELDYLNWMLDGWTRLTAAGGHVSGLEIDSDNVFSVLFETRRCPVVSVHMNYLDSTLHRELLALTDRGSLRGNLVANTLEFDGDTETFNVARDDTYVAEHEAALAGDTALLCTLDEGLDIMRMIAAAERAADEATWVSA